MNYRMIGGVLCAAEEEIPQGIPVSRPEGLPQVWLFRGDPERFRASFALTHAELFRLPETCSGWLGGTGGSLPEDCRPLVQAAEEGGLRAVNLAWPGWEERLSPPRAGSGYRLNILAMGDVGGTMLTGLRLLGAGVITSIGIMDVRREAALRWEFEANQINWPGAEGLPEVFVRDPDEFFDCDAAVFAASRGVPPVGSAVQDVRMAQYEANRQIVAGYARMARKTGFTGVYCQVSDPVDPLAYAMWDLSNRDEEGRRDFGGLLPEQVHGFGLGVMHARAAYYAKKDPELPQYLSEGRAFGPHGQELVIADSVHGYDQEKSLRLTDLAVRANLVMRELGFKPYVAPALSSAAVSILRLLQGDWHYSSVFLDGIYMGCLNRQTPLGQETEYLPLAPELAARIDRAADSLKLIAGKEAVCRKN